MAEDIAQRVIGVIARTQHIPAERIRTESTFADLNIDSLDMINIVFGLENEFDVSVPDESVQNLHGLKERRIQELVDGIHALLQAKASS